MKKTLLAAITFFSSLVAGATDSYAEKCDVILPSFWTNWYVQAGLDMSLQNPYGYSFSHVFPNGKTFGVDAAVGRWFTPGLGLRAKLNWENGIKLFENDRAGWLAPFFEYGRNMNRGGYITMVGDIQFDIQNLFWGFKAGRMWNMQAFFRAGGLYNFGVSKGSPLIGLGVGSTFRLNEHLSIYTDMAYQFVSSGHVDSSLPTGTGSNSNGFFDFNVGLQVNIGKSGFKNLSAEQVFAEKERLHTTEVVATNTFWHNWYLQFGIDMTLQDPYRHSFSEVFPKGKSFGLDFAVGKWFSPEISLRGKLNWENGFPLFKNDHLEWIATEGDKTNMEHGGYVAMSLDVPVSLTNLILGNNPARAWNVNVFPRAGLGCNLATHSASPLVGGGIEGTYRLNDRWSLVAEYGFQAITSEFFGDVSVTGMEVSTGFNCFMDFQIGVQFDLGSAPSNSFTRTIP